MGGLLSKYFTDKNAEKAGVWVEYTDLVNDDNTYPAFCVKRISPTLSALQKRLETKPDDNKAVEELSKISKRLANIFVDEILVGWKDLKYSAKLDEDGNMILDVDGNPICEELEYSKDTARELLGDADFAELLRWLMDQSAEISNFLACNRRNDLKH